MSTYEEKERIERTLNRLREEFESLSEGGSVSLTIRNSPEAAERLKRLSRELIMLSETDKGIR